MDLSGNLVVLQHLFMAVRFVRSRLAALYAVMDRSLLIERQHLKAALSLWEYAEERAPATFPGTPLMKR